jgi:hypothetical protein
VLDLVARYEGPESVAWHRAWLERQPDSIIAFRSRVAPLHGFGMHLRFGADGEDVAREVGDPIAMAATALVARTAPLRRGEHLLVGRSWMGVDGHHVPASPTFQAMATADTALWLTEPGLAVSMLFLTDVATWLPMFAYIDHAHAASADVVLAGRRYGGFLHDWRVTPPPAWLELMEPRELGVEAGTLEQAQRHLRSAPVLALSRADHDRLVREALRAAARPAELGRSPLLHARLLARPGGEATAADLRAVLERGVAAVAADPATARYARVLEVTHLRPATTQEAAAARLHLPFGTYRRHLRAGTDALTDVLWEWEIHGADADVCDAP